MAAIRLLTDEDFTGGIITGVRRRLPSLDIVRVQDVGLRSFRDELILEYAAVEDRIVLSHDFSTMKEHAAARIRMDKPMPGLFLIRQGMAIGRAVDEIVIVAECTDHEDWNSIIQHLPLR